MLLRTGCYNTTYNIVQCRKLECLHSGTPSTMWLRALVWGCKSAYPCILHGTIVQTLTTQHRTARNLVLSNAYWHPLALRRLDEVRDMLKAALKGYSKGAQYSAQRCDTLAAALFTALDDDCNDLVDALELLAALALLSGMSAEEKLHFKQLHAQQHSYVDAARYISEMQTFHVWQIAVYGVRYVFMVYDFDESRQLNVDESILALRSTVSGIAKVSGVQPPLDQEVEAIATAAFTKTTSHTKNEDKQTTVAVSITAVHAFTEYCLSTPEILSWMQYVGDVPEAVTHETVKIETLANSSTKSSSSSTAAPSNTTSTTTAAAAAAAAAGSSDAAVAVAVQKDVTRR
eukprot:9438-Heterococcus_DN1.PRE.1